MRNDRTASKYQVKSIKGLWKVLREGDPVFSGISKESCERWIHVCMRYPFGPPTEDEE